MNLHIDLDASHPAYEWLEKQADKIGAKGHFGSHIDCYTSTPLQSEFYLPVVLVDCTKSMPGIEIAKSLPSLEDHALILYTGNMYKNDYGSKAYFSDMDTTVEGEVLKMILIKKPQLILIDSYGIGQHGEDHIKRDKLCEESNCYVIENILITPEIKNIIKRIHVKFDLDYPSTGKPCSVKVV